MGVSIRLVRVGKKKQPGYRVVVVDKRAARNGRFLEILGQYDPRHEPSYVNIDRERSMHWLTTGAQTTQQVEKIFDQVGLWAEFMATKPEDRRRPPLRTGSQTEKKKPEKAAEENAPAVSETSEAESAPAEAAAETPAEPEASTEAESETTDDSSTPPE